MEMTRKILNLLGVEDERLRLQWISAAESALFAETITSFTEQIQKLGKTPMGARE